MRRYEPSAGLLGRDDIDWDALVRLHGPRLRRRVAQRVSDPAIVEDVVQETFVQAYRRWDTYDQSRPLWPWIVAISINLGWRWLQASNRVETDDDHGLAEAPLLDYIDAAGSDDHVANLDRRAAMRIALDGMTGKHRRALLRWELERRSAAELAASEGMTTEELRATVVRARRSLRRRYLAVAGEGPFAGVLVGVGGLTARWRERLARFASSGGWAEAASAFAAAPAVAVAGMAMITLAPAPTPDTPPAGSLAGEPVAFVQEAAGGAAAATSADASGVGSHAVVSNAAVSDPVEPAAPTLAAGPATATASSTPDAQRMGLAWDQSGSETEWQHDSQTNCEGGIVATAFCQVTELVPHSG